MPKATLEFDLSDFDDKHAHYLACKADLMSFVITDIAHNLKKNIEFELDKFETDSLTNQEVLDLVFERIHQKLEENNINADFL